MGNQESDVRSRLKKFIEEIGFRQYVFEKTIGVSNGYVNSIQNNIGVRVLYAIKDKFPQLNTEWLLTGKGKMLNSPASLLEKEEQSSNFTKEFPPTYHAVKENLNFYQALNASATPRHLQDSIFSDEEMEYMRTKSGHDDTFIESGSVARQRREMQRAIVLLREEIRSLKNEIMENQKTIQHLNHLIVELYDFLLNEKRN